VRYGYTGVYVADVAATLEFYERACGLARRFLHESGQYGAALKERSEIADCCGAPLAQDVGVDLVTVYTPAACY
jgi:hypothetical protein